LIAVSRIVRLVRPRKSILSRPSRATLFMSYWVINRSPFVARWSGTSSVRGSREMITPAAWVLACRATPSSFCARSVSRRGAD